MPESSSSTDSKSPAEPAPLAAEAQRQYTLLVQRQDALEKPETRRTEEISVAGGAQTSVLAALANARVAGTGMTDAAAGSVAFEAECFEGSCGACAMLINGRVGLACSARLADVSDKQGRVRLAPMRHFPLVRDLVVDRSRLARVLGSVPLEGPLSSSRAERAPTPSATEAWQLARLDQCHRCGACLEACPQYGVHSEFVGAATLHEVHLRNSMPGHRHGRKARVEAMMAPGGVQSCGKAQNCVEVCPSGLPLVDSIQSVARATTKHLLFDWLLK